MNGVHDMGGLHGFGPVPLEENEPLFHAPWERRALGLTLAMGATGQWNIDSTNTVTATPTGETINVTNILFTVPNPEGTSKCVIVQEGSTWLLANVRHRSTTLITRVAIEGDTAAIPDGLCIVTGARPGVDGPWRIESVTHSYSRGGGFITQLSLKQPGSGGAGDT